MRFNLVGIGVLITQVILGVIGVIWYDDLAKLPTQVLNAWFIFVMSAPAVLASILESHKSTQR